MTQHNKRVTWRSVKLGAGLEVDEDHREQLDIKLNLNGQSDAMLHSAAFQMSEKGTEVELAVVSLRELGLQDGASLKDIYDRAKAEGLGLCTAEVGPQLRLQYKDQSKEETLFIAMEPIFDTDSRLACVFVVGCSEDGAKFLDGVGCGTNKDQEDQWDIDSMWVFVSKK